MTIWNRLRKSPRSLRALALTGPALTLGLAAGAAFAVKKPEAHAEGMAGKVESALRLDRVNLTRGILRDEISRGNLSKLRVHVNQKTFLEYDSGEFEAEHSVDSEGIEDVSRRRILQIKLTPGVKGQVMAASDDASTIHVNFDPECAQADCALRFVAQKGKYVLAEIPAREGYKTATVIATFLGFRHRDGVLVAPLPEEGANAGLSNRLPRPFLEEITLQVRKDSLTEVELTKDSLEGIE